MLILHVNSSHISFRAICVIRGSIPFVRMVNSCAPVGAQASKARSLLILRTLFIYSGAQALRGVF